MDRAERLFDTVLEEPDRHGVLSRVILIGGWCLLMYREHFRRPPEIPLLRTVDMDFLIPRLPPAAGRVDVPGVLQRHGFSPSFAVLGGSMKFVHPEMEIEFMIPERGRGGDTAQVVAPWGITAQRLRFVGLITEHVLEVDYNGLTVKVPEPGVFVLLKYLISSRRREPAKKQRDIYTADRLGEFLIGLPEQRVKLTRVFESMPKKWQSETLTVMENASQTVYGFFARSK